MTVPGGPADDGTAPVRIHALGVAVDVDLAGSGLDEAEFRRLWARCLEPVAPPGPGAPARLLQFSRPTSYESATQRITKALIEQQWGNLLMLHAGAVADPSSGRVLAYVAPGGTGKSTLTRLLGREFGYVTDETVGIDPETLTVLPYPKPITWAAEPGTRKVEHAPESLGLQPTPEQPHLARLAVLRRTNGAAPTFTELDVLRAMEMVVPETSSLSKLPAPLHLLAGVFERVGGVTLIEYGEAEDIVGWCRESLTVPPVEHSTPGESPTLVKPAELASGAAGSTNAADLYPLGGESVILLQDTLLRLGPVATSIVRQWPRPVEELAAALEAEFGAPEDVDLIAAVEEQLETLAQHSVLER